MAKKKFTLEERQELAGSVLIWPSANNIPSGREGHSQRWISLVYPSELREQNQCSQWFSDRVIPLPGSSRAVTTAEYPSLRLARLHFLV
jgi:hypothetical protein